MKLFGWRLELDPSGKEAPSWVTAAAVVLAFLLVAVFIAATGKDAQGEPQMLLH